MTVPPTVLPLSDEEIVQLKRKLANGQAFSHLHDIPRMFTTIASRDARIKALEEALTWRPIESAPKDGTVVLIARDMGSFGWIRGYGFYERVQGCSPGSAVIEGWISHGCFEPHGNLGLAHPTHWRPFPAPPQSQDKETGR